MFIKLRASLLPILPERWPESCRKSDSLVLPFMETRIIRFPTVGIGTGCICDPMEFADLKPDIFIAIDDVVRTWTQTTFAADTGQP